jgi:hypothetical protein
MDPAAAERITRICRIAWLVKNWMQGFLNFAFAEFTLLSVVYGREQDGWEFQLAFLKLTLALQLAYYCFSTLIAGSSIDGRRMLVDHSTVHPVNAAAVRMVRSGWEFSAMILLLWWMRFNFAGHGWAALLVASVIQGILPVAILVLSDFCAGDPRRDQGNSQVTWLM